MPRERGADGCARRCASGATGRVVYVRATFGHWGVPVTDPHGVGGVGALPLHGWVDGFRKANRFVFESAERSQLGYATIGLLIAVAVAFGAASIKAVRLLTARPDLPLPDDRRGASGAARASREHRAAFELRCRLDLTTGTLLRRCPRNFRRSAGASTRR